MLSGNGDFYSLVKYLRENNKLEKVLAPNSNYSGLLKKSAASYLAVMTDLKTKLEYQGDNK